MNMGQDKQMQMIGGNGENQFRQYAGQNVGNLNGYNEVQNNVGNPNGLMGVQGNGNQNQIGNGNLVTVRAEGNAARHNGNQIRFGGNEESKKMRKTMLKQQFTEFSVTEEEGLHKGYDRFQKILSQLNQVQARPDNDDINMKFLRALPSSWSQVALALKTRGGLESMSFDHLYNKLKSLELDVRIGHNYGVQAAAPIYSAFVGASSSGSKPRYSDQQSIVPIVSQTSSRSNNIMECVLHSFVAENDPDQDMIYEDFDQVDHVSRAFY
nr:ribonuclease H-like domain-containing protein [Tanacetum cinerariifolium]